MTETTVEHARALVDKLPDLQEFSISDGSGGGEPDYIWLGWHGPHDQRGHHRYVEVGEYSSYDDDGPFPYMESVLEIAKTVPAFLAEIDRLRATQNSR